MKPTLTVLCGLPASGKSTYAEKTNEIVISSDAIRAELGDINDQSRNEEVFSIAYKRLRTELKKGNNVVFDACSVSRKSRRAILHQVSGIDCYKKCVIIYQPIDECKKRNIKRDRTIPANVIDRMVRNFDTPAKFEGFDEIILDGCLQRKSYVVDVACFYDMNQGNHHHKLTLGEHQKKACDYLCDKTNDLTLLNATYIHDCGKPLTKEYDENTKEYRYFNHNNVGAYLALGYHYSDSDPLDVSLLVDLHMQPYFWEHTDYPDFTAQKYKNRWGDELFNQVMLLHEADVYAH